MTGITDLGAEAAQSSGSENDADEDEYENNYERFDLDGCHFGSQHPVTVVKGEAVALRKLWDDDDPDRADVATILDDPDIVTEDDGLDGSVVVHSEEEGDDFKVVNTDDGDTKVLEDMGIDFDGNTFYGDVEDDFGDIERIALKRGGKAGRRISRVLDVTGGRSARVETDEDGDIVLHGGGFPQHNGGLVEFHPDDEEPYWRYARDTELRPDVEGQEIAIMLQRRADIDPDYDGNAYFVTVWANLADDRMDELREEYDEDDLRETEIGDETFVSLLPTDEYEPDEDMVSETGWLEWETLDFDDEDDRELLNERREEEGFDPYDFD